MPNNRIFYAIHAVGIKKANTQASPTAIHGVQSIGTTATFNLEQVFEAGQLEIYENIENIPDTELTISRVLDGYPPAYIVATQHTAATPDLAGRSTATSDIYLAITSDTNQYVQQSNIQTECWFKNMYPSNISFSFPVEGNMTEDITFVGNERVWKNANTFHPGYSQAGATAVDATQFRGDYGFSSGLLSPFGGSDSPKSIVGVGRRENVVFVPQNTGDGAGNAIGTDVNGARKDFDQTILPPDVYGISASGTNELVNNAYSAHVQNISVSCNLGRTPINELGRRAPYVRYLEFPTEVTCEIEVVSISGDLVSATESGIFGTGVGVCADKTNLLNRTIRIATCEGTRIFLGKKNKLASVNYNGGDAGGGNVSVTYSFSTFNDLTVMHTGETGLVTWAARTGYLV